MRKIGKKPGEYKTSLAIFLFISMLLVIGYVVIKKAPVAPTHVVFTTTATPQPVAQTQPLPAIYLIQKGDTLTKIAQKFCNTVAMLVTSNNISNPDKIYAGKKLTYVKDEQCSPESATSRTTSEKRLDRPSVRASQEKSLHLEPKSSKKAADLTTHETPRVDVKTDGCAPAGAGIADHSRKILVQAECVKRLYGEFIKDAVLQDPRISHIDIVAIMLHESSGNPKAVSHSRVPCLGLMQLQPPTAIQYGVDEKMIFDPKENIRGSVRIFSAYTYQYFGGSKDHGLAAYNRGPNSKIFRKIGFDPNLLTYVRQVKKISHILETNRFAL